MTRKLVKIIVGLGFYGVFFGAGWAQTNPMTIDSTFWLLSLPELQSHKAYYLQELQVLQEEKQNLIQRGIEDGEHLLELNPDNEFVDEILIRLADLYYYKEKDDYLTRMASFDAKLERGEVDDLMEEPRLNLYRSMELYQRIIDEFPQSKLVDDAFYNKGFLLEEMGRNDEANQIYLHIIEAHPESRYLPEAYMRLGEYYFHPPINDIPIAIDYYKKVLRFRDSARYDEALYKLGWSYYRLSEYPEAISYFTTLIEGLRIVEQYDYQGLEVRADLREEAIEYIAISFIDFGGPTKVRAFLKQIGDPVWGWDVLQKLGDVYMQEKEEYTNAVLAFETLLEYEPTSPDAPFIQKKIVDCYRVLEDTTRAFVMRQELFETYKSDGIWWKETADDKAKLNAYKLAERALRENINSIIKRAETQSNVSLYDEAVKLGRSYLESFPEDVYAYMIRWNVALILDTKLHRYDEALQEYLTICMVYNGSEYEDFSRSKGLATIKDAAENAVVVADSIVAKERRKSGGMQAAQANGDERQIIPLTNAETWLAMAYDNYLRLFPFDKKTSTILANAGALYYTHNQFNEAMKYFKTLTKYFPQSEQVHAAQYSILESYFGKRDYDSAEILAKKIIDESESSDIKKKTYKRLGEAIFLKAQTKAAAGLSSEAAAEFYRMALEAPGLEFADRALFNAGREYEKIGNYQAAIRSYELLRASYSGSPLLMDALNNLAFDYGEIGDYQKGAERYESLAELLKESDKARDALYNAFVFYGKTKNWQKGVETGERYATRYPDVEDAKTVYLQVGEYYEIMDYGEGVKRTYAGFESRFPDSPLGVEAYFRLGRFYFNKDSLSQAETYYRRAYTKNEGLKARGLEQNEYYAVEGLFFACRLLHDQYKQIAFFLPQTTLDEQVARKQSLLQQLAEEYTRVASFRTQRLPEAVYRIGEAYENFAQTWADQEIPSMDPTSRAIREKEINERTTQIYGRALAAYKRAVSVLERVMNKTITDERGDGMLVTITSDTLAVLMRTWYEYSKGKVSETLFRMAEVNTKTVDRLLAAPVPGDLNTVARLEYRSQVLIKAIKPLLDVVVEAHRRNLFVADSLGLTNGWAEKSRGKILAALNLMGQKYTELAFDALSSYVRTVREYRMVVMGDQQGVPEELLNTMVNLIELSKSYSQVTIVFYKRGVDEAGQSGIVSSKIVQTQNEMIQFVLQMADYLEKLLLQGIEDQKQADRLFQATGNLLYEEALAAYEDNVYFLEENLKSILEDAYAVEKAFMTPSPLGRWIAIRLVKLEPDTYAEKLDIPVASITVQTDTTWWFCPTHQKGWVSPDFQMIGWFHPRKNGDGNILWSLNTINKRSRTPPPEKTDSLYIRKEISVPGYPISGEMVYQTHPPTARMYWNGTGMTDDEGGEILTLTPFLAEGRNVIALECGGEENPFIGVTARIRYIPEQILPRGSEVN